MRNQRSNYCKANIPHINLEYGVHMLCVRVTCILLPRLDGIKDIMERRKMEVYLSQPLPDEGNDGDVLSTIQSKISIQWCMQVISS